MHDWPNIKAALEAGEVVLLPTETVYGLAARADSAQAVSKIYAIKGRAFNKPLAVCVRDIEQAKTLAHFDEKSERLAKKYWPGSLTLVLNVRSAAKLDPRVTMDMPKDGQSALTIALRCPDAAWRSAIERPLALTSANRSGQPDCVEYFDAMTELGEEVAASLPTQSLLSGAPSTIIRAEDGELIVLRQGALEVEL